ncbi:hypothetical protein, partial [Klebsiella michiganensis]|uniref:hypothetical protein n=1 Tax=Klebsiella michiganensis TaxID=1134687 RepID=UPI001955F0D7
MTPTLRATESWSLNATSSKKTASLPPITQQGSADSDLAHHQLTQRGKIGRQIMRQVTQLKVLPSSMPA